MAAASSAKKDDTGRQFVMVTGQQGPSGHKPPIGYTTAFLHLAKGYVGTGIFAMGEAFKYSGILLGPILLAVIAVMNLNCQHMIVNAAARVADKEEEDVKPSFAETVEYTFESSKKPWFQRHSKKIGFMTNIFLCVTEMGFCCVYFVFIAEHLLEITTKYGFPKQEEIINRHIMLAIILGPMWASTFLGSLKLLLPLTVIANILMWAGIVLIFYFTLIGERKELDKLPLAQIKTLPVFFGTTIFAFEGITFIIPLRNEMKHPEKFVSVFGVLNVGMTFVAFLFGCVGVLAYIKYGDMVESSVFLNMPSNDILAQVTKGFIAIAVLFTFTLHMYIPFEITYPLFHRKYGPFKCEILVMALYRSTGVLVTYLLANIVPLLGLFISLVGSSTGAMLALILPPIIDFITHEDNVTAWQIIKNSVIITAGVLGAITGTIMSVYDIVLEIAALHDYNLTTIIFQQ